ncbi:MAG: hypothetical protein M1839_005767 [Geoglossum umbratile]|nr:MAG: hypothetical protein M1839_005767 [Geoglossum umbratile]
MEPVAALHRIFAKELTKNEKFKAEAYKYGAIRACLGVDEELFKLIKRAAKEMVHSEARLQQKGLFHRKRLVNCRDFLVEKVLEFIDTRLPQKETVEALAGPEKLLLGVLRLLLAASRYYTMVHRARLTYHDGPMPARDEDDWENIHDSIIPNNLPGAKPNLKRRRLTRLTTSHGTESEPEEYWDMENHTPQVPNFQSWDPTAHSPLHTDQASDLEPTPARAPGDQHSYLPHQQSESSQTQSPPPIASRITILRLPRPDRPSHPTPQGSEHAQQGQPSPPGQQGCAPPDHTVPSGYDELHERYSVQERKLRDEKARGDALEAELRDKNCLAGKLHGEKTRGDNLEAKLRAEEVKGDKLEEELRDERANRDQLEVVLGDYKTKNKALVVELREEQTNHNRIEAELRSQNKKLKAELLDEKAKSGGFEARLYDEKTRSETLETLLHGENAKNEALEKLLIDEKARSDEFETKLRDANIRSSEHETQLQDEMARNNKLETQLRDEEARYSQLETRHHDEEARYSQLEERLQDEEARCSELETRLQDEKTSRARLEARLRSRGDDQSTEAGTAKRRKTNRGRGRIVVTIDTTFPGSDEDSPPPPPRGTTGSRISEVADCDAL